MAKAKKLPSGNWRVQVFAGYKKDEHGRYLLSPTTGKKIADHESITAPSKSEVEYLAAQYKVDRDASTTQTGFTVRQAMEQYVASRSNVLSPSTVQGYRKIIRNNLQSIMDIKIKKLTAQDVQNAVNSDAETLAAKTVINAHNFLSAVLCKYKPRMKLDTSLPARKKVIKRLPLPQKIFDAVHGTEIELPVLLAMWLSFTVSEIKGIRKSDISDGIITLNRVMVDSEHGTVVKDQMKEYERTRQHVVPPYIMELIDKRDGDCLVPFSRQKVYRLWMKAVRASGLPHITFHDLRHVNASVMHLLGVPDKYAMERGGWKTDATMKAVYQNVFSDERLEVDKKVDSYFENIIASHGISHAT